MIDDPAPRSPERHSNGDGFVSGLPGAIAKPEPAVVPITFDECWKYCLSERERHGIWRDDLAERGCSNEATQRGRAYRIYDTLMTLLDRNRDPHILARLREIAAADAADAKLSTGEDADASE